MSFHFKGALLETEKREREAKVMMGLSYHWEILQLHFRKAEGKVSSKQTAEHFERHDCVRVERYVRE